MSELIRNMAEALRTGRSRSRYYVVDADGNLPPALDEHGRHNTRFFVSLASAERQVLLSSYAVEVRDLLDS